jgi:hypothetical protein
VTEGQSDGILGSDGEARDQETVVAAYEHYRYLWNRECVGQFQWYDTIFVIC